MRGQVIGQVIGEVIEPVIGEVLAPVLCSCAHTLSPVAHAGVDGRARIGEPSEGRYEGRI